MTDLRVGIGYDAHALEAGVPLVLGGVEIDHPRGLAGHSDGDVIAHALIDAVLGAASVPTVSARALAELMIRRWKPCTPVRPAILVAIRSPSRKWPVRPTPSR